MAQVLPFNGFYAGSDPKNSARECVNYMPVRHDSGSLSDYTLETTTGITGPISRSFTSNPGIVISDVKTWGNITFGPIGAKTICASSGRLLMSTNGTQIQYWDISTSAAFYDVRFALGTDKVLINSRSVSASQSGWVWDGGSSDPVAVDYTAQLDPFGNENIADVAYFGSRYLLMSEAESAANPNRGRVYYSDIEDPSTYDPLGFFRALGQSSKNTGMHVLNGRLYLFSDDGYTVWSVTPNVNTPFLPQRGSEGSIGLLDPMGKCENNGVLYFIGRDGGKLGLYAMAGGSPGKISPPAIDSILNDDSSKSNIRCFSFYDADRSIIAFSIGNNTFCLDSEGGEFHKRSTEGGRWDVVGAGYTAENNNQQVFIGSTTTLNTGSFYFVNFGLSATSIGTEFGATVDRKLVTSPFNSDGVSNIVQELSFQTSIDYSSLSPVTLPDLGLSVSNDFGKSYGVQRLSAFDADGENTKLLRFMSIGFFRQAFVFKLETSNIYPHKILKMLTRLKKGFRQI